MALEGGSTDSWRRGPSMATIQISTFRALSASAISGKALASVPCLFGPSGQMVACYVKKVAGLDGPLVLLSRALMLVLYRRTKGFGPDSCLSAMIGSSNHQAMIGN